MKQKSKLTREQKISALRAIKEGKATVEILKPNKKYYFIQVSSDPVSYQCDGKYYSEAEFVKQVVEIRRSANDRGRWQGERI